MTGFMLAENISMQKIQYTRYVIKDYMYRSMILIYIVQYTFLYQYK